jgi:hypothetical protein
MDFDLLDEAGVEVLYLLRAINWKMQPQKEARSETKNQIWLTLIDEYLFRVQTTLKRLQNDIINKRASYNAVLYCSVSKVVPGVEMKMIELEQLNLSQQRLDEVLDAERQYKSRLEALHKTVLEAIK